MLRWCLGEQALARVNPCVKSPELLLFCSVPPQSPHLRPLEIAQTPLRFVCSNSERSPHLATFPAQNRQRSLRSLVSYAPVGD